MEEGQEPEKKPQAVDQKGLSTLAAGGEGKVMEGNMAESLAAISSSQDSKEAQAKLAAEKKARRAQLAAVQVKKEDINLIVTELEVTAKKAEQTLRKHNGDVVAAVRFLISQ